MAIDLDFSKYHRNLQNLQLLITDQLKGSSRLDFIKDLAIDILPDIKTRNSQLSDKLSSESDDRIKNRLKEIKQELS